MKSVLLFSITLILLSSCYTTHVSTMLNEPAFTKKGEVQASGTIGLDHVEGQAAISITNTLGVVGGIYYAPRGIDIIEGGINIYTPISKNKKTFFSTTLGFTKGTYRGSNGCGHPGGSFRATMDNLYNCAYQQVSISYNHLSKNWKNKTIFILKAEYIKFSKYDVTIDNASGLSSYSFKLRMADKNRVGLQFRPAIVHHLQLRQSIFFWQIQYGLNLMKGFKIEQIERISGNNYNSEDYLNINHAKVFPLFLNIAFGIKIN